MSDVEIIARVERRRKWTMEEKAALLAEVEAAGGRVRPVARRHRISESLLYNWRSAWKAAAAATVGSSGPVEFVQVGVIGEAASAGAARLPSPRSGQTAESKVGVIEITLLDGSRVCVDAFVSEEALSRVVRAIKGAR